MNTKEIINKLLVENLRCEVIEISDETESHIGHSGYIPGVSSHFSVKVISYTFENKSKIERHKMIYGILKELLTNNSIHALKLQLYSPTEVTDY
ncbi:MAG: BolA family transcriptional regulator [Sphingobacteriia bacterium]|nr:BolA family transcriptional regulator [Sphingobacteriia bacterium]